MSIRSGVVGLACAAVIGAVGAAGVASGESGTVVGPPAVCVPVECEDAGVKIGDAAFEKVRGYTASEAMADGLAVLAESGDVLSHMETIRRVVVYLNGDGAKSNALLAQLLARAAETEAGGAGADVRALAWFDAGYFVGASDQMGTGFGWEPGYGDGVAGLAWLDRAIERGAGGSVDVASMHFATALVAHPAMRQSKRDLYEKHMREAVAGAAEGSFLMKNLEVQAEWWDEPLAAFGGKG